MGQNLSGDRIYLALDPYAMDAKFMTPDVVYLVMRLLLEMQEYSGSVTIVNYKEVFAELQSKCDSVNLRPNDTHIDHLLSKRKKLGARGFPSSNLPTVDPRECFYRSHIYALDEPIGAHNQLKPGYIAICPKRVSVLPYALCVDLCNHLQGLCNVVGGTAFGRHVLEIFMWRSGAELCQKHSVVQHQNYLLNLTSNGGWTENMDEAIAMENVLNPYFVKMFC